VIVVGTNAVAYLCVPTRFTVHAGALLERDPDRMAPVPRRSEFRAILAGCMRRKTPAFEEARALQTEAESLLAGNEHEVDSQRVLELVRDSDCSAHDREFAALAIRGGTKLVTVDRKLLRAFSKHALPLTAG
jgi:predicted nucleic acid-binding protein